MTPAAIAREEIFGPGRNSQSGDCSAGPGATDDRGKISSDLLPAASAALPSIPTPPATAQAPRPSSDFLNITRPLASVWGAALLLNRNEESVERLIEDGELAWAFNIGAPAARARQIRIFMPCILDCRAGVNRAYAPDFVLNAIFPAARLKFRTHEVAYACHCSADHVRLLALQGVLKKIPGAARRGPNSSCFFARTVLTDFLQKRRIM